MAKQEKQKQKGEAAARKDQAAAIGPQSPGAATTAVTTKPLPPGENAENRRASIDDSPLVTGKIRRRRLLIGGAGALVTAAVLGGWLWKEAPQNASQQAKNGGNGDRLVILWNNAALQAIQAQQSSMPVAARALGIVHTCMFDAWAAYDPVAVGTRLGGTLRQPIYEQTLGNKCQAISYAAYYALLDLFPTEKTRFRRLMSSLKYDPDYRSNSKGAPAGVANLAAQAVLSFRHGDGSNQLGNLHPGAYSDYTKYRPVNTVDTIKNPSLWQPLHLPFKQIGWRTQRFADAQWGNVTPFALQSAEQFVPRPGPPRYPSTHFTEQAQQILQYSAGLTDEQKTIAEYWDTGPNQAQVLAHWFSFAQFVSRRDGNTLDQNIKLFFILANAELDASIACWATKRVYDSAYPITVIHYLFKGKQVRAWAGTGKDVQQINGQYWLPYQQLASIAPDFPEYCSEQSAFSYAAATILRHFTGSDELGTSYIQPAHSSAVEFDVPDTSVTLDWRTFTQAANQAGVAGRYGGIHFTQSDLDGRTLGNQVGEQVWLKAQRYINGHTSP